MTKMGLVQKYNVISSIMGKIDNLNVKKQHLIKFNFNL